MTDKIIINKEYFDNIGTAINSINDFIGSGFTKKNFPNVDDDVQLDSTVLGILNWLNSIDPELVQDSSKLNEMLDEIREHQDEYEGPDVMSQLPEDVADKVYAIIGCKMLEMISNNFEEFSKLINGLYSFDIFVNPSKYSDVIELFSQPLELYDLRSALNDDINVSIFDPEKYVSGIFNNDQIQLPDKMDVTDESERIKKKGDLKNVEVMVDETKMEAAEIDFFEKDFPKHIRYMNGKWMVSQQFQALTKKLIDALKKCDNTGELMLLFSKPNKGMTDFIGQTVAPFIMVKTLTNPKKSSSEIDEDTLKKYTDSYDSIIKQNKGAGRFKNYDLFSCFKADKENTIKFIEDFMSLNLMNDPECGIGNNTLLTLFNIFDSHIYLTLMFNETHSHGDVNEFIKTTRARINKNSRELMKYNDKDNVKTGNKVNDSETIKEYTTIMEKAFGDMDPLDIQYCEAYQDLLYDEISLMNDSLYNEGFSQIGIDQWIGESYEMFMEAADKPSSADEGEVPGYIKRRIKTNDDLGTSPNPTTTEVDLPKDVPQNPYDDLADSVDERMDTESENGLEGMLGKGYKGPIGNGESNGRQVIYNITYNNSFNKDSYNNRTNTTTTNDSSTGKTVTNTNTMTNSHNDSSSNKNLSRGQRVDSHNTVDSHNSNITGSYNTGIPGANSYNNSNTSSDTVADNKLSNGLSVQEMFAILESMEPLSEAADATPPKEDTLTRAMDNDRKLLATQQKAKQKLQKGVNTTKAVLRPVTRAKAWMTKMVDSLIKRNEDQVKAEIVESHSYRTALYKASRLALKLGLVGISMTISGYLAAAVATCQVLSAIDKDRLKKEVQSEMITEIAIIDDKIEQLDNLSRDDPSKLKEKYALMRQRNKMLQMASTARTSNLVHPNSIA